MDHDTYSAGSLIGTCVIDLNTMLMRPDYDNTQDSCFSGWIPIYDTLEGIRGELYVDVSFQSIGDKNVGIHPYLGLLSSNRRKDLPVSLSLLEVFLTVRAT